MININAMAEEKRWLMSQVKPLPEVIILAYAGIGGGVMNWKPVALMSESDWQAIGKQDRWVGERCRSAICYVVVRTGKENNESK